MSGVTKKLMGTTAAGGGFTAIEDVFSTYLYTGNGSTQTITNYIDLAGEGGLVWNKPRSGTYATDDHALSDTERGVNKILRSNTTSAEAAGSVQVYNSDGFTLGSATGNLSSTNYASWTFRKAPRFFDVVTYTGDGVTSRQIAHDLGVAPGVVIVKCTSQASEWMVFHRNNPDYLILNRTDANATGSGIYIFGDGTSVIPPTDAVFTVYGGAESGNFVNASGQTYVAYLFAHDPLGPSEDGSDGLIACGSVTGTNTVVDLGWEPQFLLMKQSSTSGSWFLVDNMRGFPVASSSTQTLFANSSEAEGTFNIAQPTSTGFINGGQGGTLVYIAIRRGPMRAPTSGTEVFAVDNGDGSSVPAWTSGFPVDMAIERSIASDDGRVASRLTSGTYLITNSTAAEAANSARVFDYMNGWLSIARSTSNYSWMFRRAPEFFDVVAYTGNGVAGRTVPHNLGVAPEMMIVKGRTNTENWVVYHSASGATQYLRLNTNNAAATSSVFWNNTAPTDTEFTVGAGNTNNASGINYIAYLFASVAGVSKVGSYTGNGSSQTINCGFTAGARFVLIKRISSTGGNWLVWDTARGIVVGNEPYLGLNLTTAETSVDYIDPDPAGFKVINVNTNNSGDTYIFYAIA